MILSLSLCAAALGSASTAPLPPEPTPLVQPQDKGDKKAEYDRRRKEAGKDAAKLWEVYLWCDANGMEKEARSCLRAVVRADPDHREAHLKLGHLEYDGKWFTTQKKLDQYKRKNEERINKEKGLVRFEDGWVPKEDLPYLERGLTLNEDGEWVSAEELEKIKAGWQKQDTTWISPEEMPNVEKGLWKCGEKWLTLEKANEYHQDIGKWWIIPTDHFIVYTTCDRDVAMKAIDHMDRAYRDVAKVLGSTPEEPVNVGLFRSLEQYSLFAAGSEAFPSTDARGLSSVHGAYFADLWFNPEPFYLLGAGVGYWDASTENGNLFGVHQARHAAALSLVEAADPSPGALDGIRKKKEPDNAYAQKFWDEKKLPEWFRSGTASYADRYFVDQFVGRGGDPHWARKWSIQNLMSRGGLRPLKQIFDTFLDVNQADDSKKSLIECGLVVSFIIDGKCPPVAEKHGALKRALKTGEGIEKAFKNLQNEVTKNEKALREFAGI